LFCVSFLFVLYLYWLLIRHLCFLASALINTC
jgi:hypothetical protein